MENILYILTPKELEELLTAKYELSALHRGGVDNWTWYGESLNSRLKELCNFYDIQMDEDIDFSVIAKKVMKERYNTSRRINISSI